jgi:hypothetical protein
MVVAYRFGYYGGVASIKDVYIVFIIFECAINFFINRCNILTLLSMES